MTRWQLGPGRSTAISTVTQAVIQAQRWHWLVLLLWIVPLLLSGFFDLDHQSLMAHDEGLYARRARVMVDTGDWVHPWDVPQHKTPGPYWVVALFIQIFGRHEVAVRLPSVLASIGCLLLTYAIGRRLLSPTAAFLGALSLGVAPLWLQYSRLATPDVMFTGLVLLAVWLLLIAEHTSHRPWLYFAAGTALGLTVLIRSALAIVPVVCLLPYLLLSKRQHLKQRRLYLGVLVGLVPTAIWLWLCWQRYDTAVLNALINFPVNQSLTTDRAKSPFFYLFNLLGNNFLWIFFALGAAARLVKKLGRANHKLIQLAQPQISLLLIYPLAYLGLLSFASTKLPHYAIPTYPFLALLTGYAMDYLIQIAPGRATLLNALNCLLGCLGGFLALAGCLALVSDLLPSTSDIRPYAPIALGLGLIWLGACLAWFKSRPGPRRVSSWLVLLLLGHWVSLVIAWGTAGLGNINPEMKALLLREDIQPVLQTEFIDFSPGINSKHSTLLRFYTPNPGEKLQALGQASPDDYLWIDNSELPRLGQNYDDLGQIKQTHLVRIRPW